RGSGCAPAGATDGSGRPRSSAAQGLRPLPTSGSARRARGRVLVVLVGSSFQQLLRERAIRDRASTCGIELQHRLTVAGRFADAHVAWDQGFEQMVWM